MDALTVTTFDTDKHWESHARRMVESVVDRWPTGLRVYACLPPDFEDLAAKTWWMSTLAPLDIPPKPRARDDWQHDVHRFAWKVAAILHAAETTDARYLFWLDADTYVHRTPSPDELVALFDGKPVCYLGREGGYPETGFLGFDLSEEGLCTARSVLNHVRWVYESGTIYKLRGWTDIHAFGDALEECYIDARELSPTASGWHHALTMSPLAQWLDHMKGPRKEKGYSPEHPESERLAKEAKR